MNSKNSNLKNGSILHSSPLSFRKLGFMAARPSSSTSSSKPSLPMDHGGSLQRSRRFGRRITESLAGSGEEDVVVDYDEYRELQLLQASIGAKRLTQMIDSWSRSLNLDDKSKDAAKGIVREALELQESLGMLKKLQDATKVNGGISVSDSVEPWTISGKIRRHSGGGSGVAPPAQEPRLSADDLCRVSADEFRNLMKSNQRSPKSETLEFDGGKTSPSQSSIKQVRRPNLIAKLMGLEDVQPVEDSSKISRPEEEHTKKLMRETSDVEVPRVKKLPLRYRAQDPKMKSLQSIIESIQCKGISIDDEAESSKLEFVDENASLLEWRTKQIIKEKEPPPIVIMKPIKSHEETLSLRKITVKEKKKIEIVEGNLLSVKLERSVSKLDSSRRFKIIRSHEQRKDDLNSQKVEDDDGQRSSYSKAKGQRNKKEVKPSFLIGDSEIRNSPDETIIRGKLHKASPASINDMKNVKDDNIITSSYKNHNAISTAIISYNSNESPKQENLQREQYNQDNKSEEDTKTITETVPKSTQNDKSPTFHGSAQNPLLPPPIDDIKSILLSSKWFLSQAKEFVSSADPRKQTYFHAKELQDQETRNARLYFGCAKELMIRKQHLKELSYHPFPPLGPWQRLSPSLDQLVEEFTGAFQKLESFNEVDGQITLESRIRTKLERDLLCKNVIASSVWDLGWVEGTFWVDGADMVVGEMEDLILAQIVEEIAFELLC